MQITRRQQERRIVREMTPHQRAHYQRLIAFRDSYQGKSQVEKLDRQRRIDHFLLRVG